MTREEILEKIEELHQSPIYAMSLGSKELFHSNFWAWITEQDEADFGRTFVNFFFSDVNTADYVVTRENQHRDITITFSVDGRPIDYVIENKLKAVPTKKQLENYSCEKGVLTGLSKPVFEMPTKWHFVSYEEICQKLRSLEIKDHFIKKIVYEYCNNLDDLQNILIFSLSESPNELCYEPSIIDGLKKIRVHDIFKKIKAQDFVKGCQKFKDKYSETINDWTYETDFGYNNGNPTISFYFSKEIKTDNEKPWHNKIGVQIEGDQFRLFLVLKDHKNDETFKLGCDELNWFEKIKNKKFLGNSTSMRKNYCKYWDHWIYQYFTIDKEWQSYEKLTNEIEKQLDRVKNIILSGKI